MEEGKDVAAIVAESGLSRDLVDYVIARTDANAFKRALEPPYPDAPFYSAPRPLAKPRPASDPRPCWRTSPVWGAALFNRLVSYTPRCMARGGAVVYHSGHG